MCVWYVCYVKTLGLSNSERLSSWRGVSCTEKWSEWKAGPSSSDLQRHVRNAAVILQQGTQSTTRQKRVCSHFVTLNKRLWIGALTSAGESVCLSKYLGHLRRLQCAYMSVRLTIGWFLWSGPPSELHSPFYQPAPSSHPPAACWSCSSSHTWWLATGMRTNVGGGEHAIKHNIVKCQITKLSKSNAW